MKIISNTRIKIKSKLKPNSKKYSLCQMIIDRILFRGREAPLTRYTCIPPELTAEYRKWATYNYISAEHSLLYYYASLFKNNIYPKYELKFYHLKKILQNPFLDIATHNKFMDLFSSFQKTYWGFSRFVRLWKYKKACVRINTDLYMGVIEPSHKYTFCLLQQKNIYYFTLYDLKHLFLNSLSNHYNFVGSPLPLKNPYNNIVFLKSDLYNIYFQMKYSGFPIHRFIEYYFQSNFNIYRFQMKYGDEVREYNISAYSRNLSAVEKVHHIFEMISVFDEGYRLNIHAQYPNEKIIDALGSFLKLYFLYRFTANLVNKNRYADILTRKIREFVLFNPFFGRLKHKRPKKSGIPVVLEYHNKNEMVRRDVYDSFLGSHIYNDARYNRIMYSGINNRNTNQIINHFDLDSESSETEIEEEENTDSIYESDEDDEQDIAIF